MPRHTPIRLEIPAARLIGICGMVVVFGFFCVLAAGMTCAYFIGARAARPSVIYLQPPAYSTSPTPAGPPPPPSAKTVVTATDSGGDVTSCDPPARPAPAAIPPPKEFAHSQNGVFANTRRFSRLTFAGTAMATIYPHHARQKDEPVQCVVATRDLSSCGISIGHTEQLYPSQMIVLNAVGKLLVAEIRWCHRIDSHYYIAGCRLVKAAS